MVYRLVLSPEQQQQQELITLTAAQRHYLGNVLRLADGDRLMVMDGRGGLWLATFLTSTVQRLQPIAEDRELPITVTLAIALPKGNSFDDVLRACTELGATCFQPILSQRTLLKPSAHKQARWQRIVTEAAEQCERQWIPDIAPPVSWSDFLSSLSDSPNAPLRLLCACRSESPRLGAYLKNTTPLPSHLLLATGPEGGWTDKEINQAIDHGFQLVSLGKRILRAVTAPTAALAQIVAVAEA